MILNEYLLLEKSLIKKVINLFRTSKEKKIYFNKVLGISNEIIEKEYKKFLIVRKFINNKNIVIQANEPILQEGEDFYTILDKEFKSKKQLNIREIKEEIKSNNLSTDTKKKLENCASIIDISVDSLIKELKENSILADLIIAALLSKNITRQNIPEKTSFAHLKKIDNNFIKLPQSGTNAIILNDEGEILKRETGSKYKALDFYIKKNDIEYYILQKYTNEKGGAQDSQYNEALFFLSNASFAPTASVNKSASNVVNFFILLQIFL